MMYRPERMKENPFIAEVEDIKRRARARGIEHPWFGEPLTGLEAWDEGASAMLEALKEEGTYFSSGEWDFQVPGKGWVVFIPEGE